MSSTDSLVVTWSRVGAITGIAAALVYPLLIAVPMPDRVMVILAAAFGPLLSVASIGLFYFLGAHRRTVTLQIAVVSNVIAGTIVNLMLVVQLTIREFYQRRLGEATEEASELWRTAYTAVDSVQLGLDVSWDVYISLGTIFFALNMIHHPRFGRVMGWSGVVIGLLLLGFNFSTFPVPPAESGSIDFGPLSGLWYLIVSILVLRSIGWLRRAQAADATSCGG